MAETVTSALHCLKPGPKPAESKDPSQNGSAIMVNTFLAPVPTDGQRYRSERVGGRPEGPRSRRVATV